MVDATDGSTLAIRDGRAALYSGSATVFRPNPVVTSGNHNLANNSGGDTTDLTAQLVAVTLGRLDSSGYLRGSWVDAQLSDNIGTRASSTANPRVFTYTRGNNHFEEAMAYYHYDRAQEYLQSIWTGDANQRVQPVVVNEPMSDRNAYYVQDSAYSINGTAMAYPIIMGRPPTTYPDLAEDADVLLHEYNHAIQDDLQGRDYLIDYTDSYGGIVGTAIFEGSADFFACNSYPQVGYAFTQNWNDAVADWAWAPTYLRKVTCTIGVNDLYSCAAVNPSTIGNYPYTAYDAAPFWSDTLWALSKSAGRTEADRLWLEWAGTIDNSPTWTEAANSLIVADAEQNPDATGNESKNKHLIMTALKTKGIPSLTDETRKFVSVQVEHADLSKLRVKIGVRSNSGSIRASYTLATFGELSGSGSVTFVKDVTSTFASSYWPPRSDYVWFATVEENPTATETTIHDQGVVRDFHVFMGSEEYPDPDTTSFDTWVPIREDATIEVAYPVTLSRYAEISVGHADFSQLEMDLGVKDLTDDSGVPGLQMRLTKGGMTGWATPAAPRVIRVDLSATAYDNVLPASLARRWYLGLRDTTSDEYDGRVTGLSVYSSGASQGGAGLPADISETSPQYINLSVSPPATASASAKLTFSGTATVKVGVGATGSPYWLSSAWSSPYTSLETSSSTAYYPPDLTYRWFLSVANSTTSTGTIDRFAFYDPEAPRIYRSASPSVTIGANATVYAKLPFKDTATFTDVPTTHWAWMPIEGLNKAGIAGGYGDGTFGPDGTVLRDAMAVFVARAYAGGEAGLSGYTPPTTATYVDVPTSYWAYKHIEYCTSRGIVSGYTGGYYHPEYSIDRGQLGGCPVRS